MSLLRDYSFDWADDVVRTVPVASVPVVEPYEFWFSVLALLYVECVYGGRVFETGVYSAGSLTGDVALDDAGWNYGVYGALPSTQSPRPVYAVVRVPLPL